MPPRITRVRWSASSIPWGMTFNEQTGTFKGTPEDVGEYTVPVTVETNYGRDTKDVIVKVKEKEEVFEAGYPRILIDSDINTNYLETQYINQYNVASTSYPLCTKKTKTNGEYLYLIYMPSVNVLENSYNVESIESSLANMQTFYIADGQVLNARLRKNSSGTLIYDNIKWEITNADALLGKKYSSSSNALVFPVCPDTTNDYTSGYVLNPCPISLSQYEGAIVQVHLTENIDYEDLIYPIEDDIVTGVDAKYKDRALYPYLFLNLGIKVFWTKNPMIYCMLYVSLFVDRSSFTKYTLE